jgi:hypothetical protein
VVTEWTPGSVVNWPNVMIRSFPASGHSAQNARSHSREMLHNVKAALLERTRAIGDRRGLKFQLGRISSNDPAPMAEPLRRRLFAGARELGIPILDTPSGAGHGAADFSQAGVPSAMIFVRNGTTATIPPKPCEWRISRWAPSCCCRCSARTIEGGRVSSNGPPCATTRKPRWSRIPNRRISPH